jgi:diguanylate cyclase (GGDEF)-like protein
MIPDLDADREKPAAYYFMPLYFNSHSFGYSVMKYTEPRSLNIEYRSWLNYVSYGFECMRRQLHIKTMYRQIQLAAHTDNLTGLYNRNAFNNYIVELTSRAMGGSVKAMFMMADLNYLKTINDTYGHLGGDMALRAVGKALRHACGENERCYRFGGDEFMIIGVGEYSEERIAELSARINDYLESHCKAEEIPFKVTASLGAVCSEINADTDIESLIIAADEIMYENKRRSKSEA